jgi:hypothetical protein
MEKKCPSGKGHKQEFATSPYVYEYAELEFLNSLWGLGTE